MKILWECHCFIWSKGFSSGPVPGLVIWLDLQIGFRGMFSQNKKDQEAKMLRIDHRQSGLKASNNLILIH